MEMPVELFEDITGLSHLRTGERARGKRASGRVPVARSAMVCRVVLGEAQRPIVAVVRELSLGGIGLVCTHKLRRGEQFVAHLPRRMGDTIPVRYVTVRCERGRQCPKGETTYTVGASFATVMHPAFLPGETNRVSADQERISRAILD